MNKPQGRRSQKKKGYYNGLESKIRSKKEAKQRDRKKRQARSSPTTYAQHRLIRSRSNAGYAPAVASAGSYGDRIPGFMSPAGLARKARRKVARKRIKEQREAQQRLDEQNTQNRRLQQAIEAGE